LPLVAEIQTTSVTKVCHKDTAKLFQFALLHITFAIHLSFQSPHTDKSLNYQATAQGWVSGVFSAKLTTTKFSFWSQCSLD